jgi:hypothetical protein
MRIILAIFKDRFEVYGSLKPFFGHRSSKANEYTLDNLYEGNLK